MKVGKFYGYKNISGPVIKSLRLKSGLSQAELSVKVQLLGVELTSKEISKIETNNRLIQDFELFAFAKVFDVPTDVFCSKDF